ncbi:tetratricopeptide repeat protein [Alphaproteobacteria bacterium]|nr:tetratricopeptide repeat protein [Alphaproteobacteria bacterium]
MLAKLSLDQAFMKAKSHIKKDEVIEAKKLYQIILQAFPKNLRAHQGLAALNKTRLNNVTQIPPQEVINQLVNLYNQRQFSVVVEQAQDITDQYPEAIIAWNILGASAAERGMLDEAIEAYNKAISLKPDYADAYYNMGNVLKDQGKLDEAIEAYNKSISLKPDFVVSYYNMGNILKNQGKLDEAIKAYNKSISLNPDYTDAYSNMGNALKDQGKLDEAIEAYNKAISLKPDYADAYYNMGNALKDQGKLGKAIVAYNKAISLKSDYADAYNNMGVTLQFQNKLYEAIEAFNKSISLNPDYADTHKNLSFTLLNSGRLQEGLNEYEWRWKTKKFLSQQRYFSQPLWDGEKSLNGKRILLWCEQGIGDTINWSSCLSLVTSQAEHCILECQEKLVPLLERSFPKVEVKAVNKSLDSERDDFDYHLPMGSLYKHFIKEIGQNAKPDAYLVPDSIRVNFWRERLNSLGKGPYIGVSWKSSNMSPDRLPNYTSISDLSPILNIPNVTFINLQYKDFVDDLTKIQDKLGVTVNNFDDLDHYNNIDDVAALCTALDIVVSTKITVPLISAGVGTLTKLANWRQSSWNNVLFNPVSSSIDMYERDTWETWDITFRSIAKDISQITKANHKDILKNE